MTLVTSGCAFSLFMFMWLCVFLECFYFVYWIQRNTKVTLVLAGVIKSQCWHSPINQTMTKHLQSFYNLMRKDKHDSTLFFKLRNAILIQKALPQALQNDLFNFQLPISLIPFPIDALRFRGRRNGVSLLDIATRHCIA